MQENYLGNWIQVCYFLSVLVNADLLHCFGQLKAVSFDWDNRLCSTHCHRKTSKMESWFWEVMGVSSIVRLLRSICLIDVFLLSFFFIFILFFVMWPQCPNFYLCLLNSVKIIIKIAAGNGVAKILVGRWVIRQLSFTICLHLKWKMQMNVVYDEQRWSYVYPCCFCCHSKTQGKQLEPQMFVPVSLLQH